MVVKTDDATRDRRYRAKVTGRHAITLPAELCRHLDIDNGDVIELVIAGRQAVLTKAEASPLPPARGILRGLFDDAESVSRYIEEERRGWTEREQDLDTLRSYHLLPKPPSGN